MSLLPLPAPNLQLPLLTPSISPLPFPPAQAALFGQLSAEVLERRAARRYDAESLALAGKLLELHPEVYSVWNFRREALQPVGARRHGRWLLACYVACCQCSAVAFDPPHARTFLVPHRCVHCPQHQGTAELTAGARCRPPPLM